MLALETRPTGKLVGGLPGKLLIQAKQIRISIFGFDSLVSHNCALFHLNGDLMSACRAIPGPCMRPEYRQHAWIRPATACLAGAAASTAYGGPRGLAVKHPLTG